MKFLVYILVFSCLFASISCNVENSRNISELENYINDTNNKLKKQIEFQNHTISLTFKPYQLIFYKNIENNDLLKLNFDSLDKEYSKYHYLLLNINSRVGIQYINKMAVQNIDFNLAKYIFIKNNKNDKFHNLIDFSVVKNITSNYNPLILLVFEKQDSDFSIFIKDFGLGLGDFSVDYNIQDIYNIPALRI